MPPNNGLEPSSFTFCYGKSALSYDSMIIFGTCLHKIVEKLSESQQTTAFSLNGFDSRTVAIGSMNWKDNAYSWCGAVLATELENNSCKLAKWTARLLLSGEDQWNNCGHKV